MKNFKTFYEKNDEECCEELIEKEPKERRNRKFREKREIEYVDNLDRNFQRLIPKRW